jgi:alpha-beta hydrolase superfamily lysophospholipase
MGMIRLRAAFGLVAAVLVGCNKDGAPGSQPISEVDAAPRFDASPAGPPCDAAGPLVVKLTTDDGVSLEADLHTTGKARGPAAVLLHMIPPANDRRNYPAAFVSALVTRGISVLNVDRRGAGGSSGDAMQAYLGPKGKLDAKAAVAFLVAHPCAIDATRVAIVGASNGTTTALDYATVAETPPAALVFLTGGMYSENQTKIDEQRPLLDRTPILFVFSTAESAWSKRFAPGAPSAWVFKEYEGGDHGTRMFAAQPKSVADVADFVASSIARP